MSGNAILPNGVAQTANREIGVPRIQTNTSFHGFEIHLSVSAPNRCSGKIFHGTSPPRGVLAQRIERGRWGRDLARRKAFGSDGLGVVLGLRIWHAACLSKSAVLLVISLAKVRGWFDDHLFDPASAVRKSDLVFKFCEEVQTCRSLAS